MPSSTVAKWDFFEASFEGPKDGNPFIDVELEAIFTQKSREVRVPGFYDGDGVYRIRFMPDTEGEWSFRTRSKTKALDGKTGSFVAGPAGAGNHGPVHVRNTFHFGHADGTPFLSFGTTCYAWTHQPLDQQAQTLETLKEARFNKMRMCVFPKDYPYNTNEPLFDVYQRGADGKLDFDRPNPEAFRHFETQVGALRDLGIEADIIVFHQNHALHPLLREWEHDLADAVRRQRIRCDAAGLALHRTSGFERPEERGRSGRLNTDDPHALLIPGGNAADQSPAPAGNQERIERAVEEADRPSAEMTVSRGSLEVKPMRPFFSMKRAPMLEVMITMAFLKSMVLPRPSVRCPSSKTWRSTLKTSGWAFSISSRSTTE